MSLFNRKVESFVKIFFTNKVTTPKKMGENILLLATAPCANEFFENESVQEQFKDYDLAFINYMSIYLQDELFKHKPRYLILMDPIFYRDYNLGTGEVNEEKQKVKSVLEKINWECYVVTSVLAEFGVDNSFVHYIRLSCFDASYKKILLPFFKRNWLNLGVNNVIQAALFFAITFKYSNVAILGCTYKTPEMFMDVDGLHIFSYDHCYDLVRKERIITNEQLEMSKEKYVVNLRKRAYESVKILWDLNKYAKEFQCNVTNYSEGSMIDSIKMGKLII